MRLRWMAGYAIVYAFGQVVLKVRVTGRNKLVPGPQILASNHVSNFDPLLVGLGARREVHFLAKDSLFAASRFFAWLIHTYNAWPVRREGGDPAAMKRCSWLLGKRQTIVLFPEGTRSKTGDINGFKPGIGMLAIANHVPVVPVHLGGVSRSIISYLVDRDFVKRGFRKKPQRNEGIHIAFADPVYPTNYAPDRQGYVELTQEVEKRVRMLAGTQAKSDGRSEMLEVRSEDWERTGGETRSQKAEANSRQQKVRQGEFRSYRLEARWQK